MDTITIGTFNCENLFARYRFRDGLDPDKLDGFTVNDVAFDLYTPEDKRITAEAIRATHADVLALQEVEGLPVLDTFTSRLLESAGYTYRAVVHGNDPRNIDVAVLSKLLITRLRSWRHLRSTRSSLFSRDLLEVDVEVPVDDSKPRTLTLFVNHLKSMMEGRAATHDRRAEQVHELVRIVADRVGPDFERNFVVLGDMNDYLEEDEHGGKTALGELAGHPFLVNANDALAADDRWTHYYAGGEEYRQLDFLWVGRAFYERAGRPVPSIVRQGLPLRATRFAGKRFAGVGHDRPKASDHCPVNVTVPTSALT
jgi:endonuclease/exonuclease/phosphatase family metal-dependent hydrolase